MPDRAALSRTSKITIRPLQDVREMGVAIELQRRAWGYSEFDAVPDQVFVVPRKSGGHVLAAFDGIKPVGFALAFAVGRRRGELRSGAL